MGSYLDSDPFGHAILILRAVRAGVLTLDERAYHYTFQGETRELGLFTGDGSYLSSKMVKRIRQAVIDADEASDSTD
jgi:hypothetical protein